VRLLIDTHILLWWLADDDRLPAGPREAVNTAEDVRLSAASVWEIGIKRALGRLEVPEDYLDAVDAGEIDVLAISAHHAEVAGALPRHHDDPFDRMLVAQAKADDLTLVTADRRLTDYDVPVLLARQ
jgi:PIN domain nuclease of toxin-antitoxin system